MPFKTLHQLWHPDIAIDLGTSTTRVAVMNRGYRFSAPSRSGIIPALERGVIVNVDAATDALSPALRQLRHHGVSHPRALACAPTDTSDEEREAIRETCYRAGVAAVLLMPEPLAAAIGDGVDYYSPLPTVVMDIGEGVTDCAVIREGRLAGSFASRVACADLHTVVRAALCQFSSLPLTARQAMQLVYEVGVAQPLLDDSGFPNLRFVTIPDQVIGEQKRVPAGIIQQAMEPVIERILETIHSLFIEIPTLRNEIQSSGTEIHLSGGGALIPGFAERISDAVRLPVQVVRYPLEGVVIGAKRILPVADRFNLWQHVTRHN